MSQEKGIAHLLLILVAGILVAGLLLLVLRSSQISQYLPESIRPFIGSGSVAPKADYQNPLDKKSQYSNPFEENKNPFDNLK